MTALLYVYCILDAGSPALDLLDRGTVAGIEPGAPLFALQHAGLAAAVSEVPDEIFDEQPLNELTADLTRLAPYALRHELAIRTLFEHGLSLLPLSFGAVYRSRESVLAMLEARAGEFQVHLERLRGREEWEVKLSRRPAAQLAAMARAAAPAQVSGAGPGRADLMARLQERRAAAEAIGQIATVAAAVAEALRSAATELRSEPVDIRNTGDVELVERFAALVPRAESDRFQEHVAALEQRYAGGGFSLALSGPWAPYSFVGQDGDGH